MATNQTEEQNKTKEAMRQLRKALVEDPAYYEAWKTSLGSAFREAHLRGYRTKGIDEVINDAAERFLKTLTHSYKKSKP